MDFQGTSTTKTITIGELASDNDSSHRIEIVRRDEEKITDISEFEGMELVQSVVEYEMIFDAYEAISKVDEESPDGTYPLGEINMNDASVLTEAEPQ